MRKTDFIGVIIILITFSGCSLDKPKISENVVKDFNLGWWSETRYTALFLNNDHEEYGGREIIPETVVEIGYNEDFIIAKQHPNLYKEIKERVLDNETDLGFELTNASDTVYLPNEFLINSNGKWILKKEGVENLDYLFPYKEITYYYIVKIGDYRLRYWAREGNVFRFESEQEFNAGRIELGVPQSLELTPVDLSQTEN